MTEFKEKENKVIEIDVELRGNEQLKSKILRALSFML